MAGHTGKEAGVALDRALAPGDVRASLERALMMCVVNRNLSGVLISGPSGSGKSYRVRKFMREHGISMATLPLHATEEVLADQVDLETTLRTGTVTAEKGFISRNEGGIIYIDDVNLLRPAVLQQLWQAEKDTVTGMPRFTIIGSMNPSEGLLPQAVLEKFDLFVQVDSPGREERLSVLKEEARKLKDTGKSDSRNARPAESGENHDAQGMVKVLQETEDIRMARKAAESMECSKAHMLLAASYCRQAGTQGNDAEMVLLRAAAALGAIEKSSFILPKHIEEAAVYVLPHRMHEVQGESESQEEPEESRQEQPAEDAGEDASPESTEETDFSDGGDGEVENPPAGSANRETSMDSGHQTDPGKEEEGQEESSGSFSLPDIVAAIGRNLGGLSFGTDQTTDRFARSGSGKRMMTQSDTKEGRYVRAVMPKGKDIDLAVDATIRAAAPYQRLRDKHGLAIAVHKEDWRSKQRERRIGRHILFVVDASGSMGAEKRMEAVKGAIYSLLRDAYEKRDSVGLIVFREKTAEVVIPFTRSVELAQKNLEKMATGGRTPLAEGLHKAYEELRRLFIREPHGRPLLVLVTDGRATYGQSSDPAEEAMERARELASLEVESIVIDTENDFVSMGIARPLARILKAAWYPLDSINENAVLRAVQGPRLKK